MMRESLIVVCRLGKSLIVACLLLCAQVAGQSPAAQSAPSVVGTRPELALPDLSGVEQSLVGLRGRVVVLNFWATWCGPCRREMPDLVAIQKDYAALGVQVVGASADAAEDRAKVLEFIRETKINFPVWTGATARLMPRFGLGPVLPGTVVLDREGRIVSSSNAAVKPEELRKQLDALLAAKPPADPAPAEERKDDPRDPRPSEAGSREWSGLGPRRSGSRP